MKSVGVLVLCGVAVAFVGARKKEQSWEAPYTPTRLEWLALQSNINHRQRYEMVHSGFVAVPPNKIEVVVKFAKEAKQFDAELRKSVSQGAKEYVRGMANAMHWTEPLEIESIELFQ